MNVVNSISILSNIKPESLFRFGIAKVNSFLFLTR